MNWFVIGNAFTPKALHNKAQGREQSERTLGWTHHPVHYPEGAGLPRWKIGSFRKRERCATSETLEFGAFDIGLSPGSAAYADPATVKLGRSIRNPGKSLGFAPWKPCPFRVKDCILIRTQGARRRAATLGYVVERLRRKPHALVSGAHGIR